jgi:hypothetical protein
LNPGTFPGGAIASSVASSISVILGLVLINSPPTKTI